MACNRAGHRSRVRFPRRRAYCEVVSLVAVGALTLLVLAPQESAAERRARGEDFILPGIRIGYTFGAGLTVGVDVSAHRYWNYGPGPMLGASTGFDVTFFADSGPSFRLYLHGEGGLFVFGAGYGPSLIWGPHPVLLSWDVEAFGGFPLTVSHCTEPLRGLSGALYYRYSPRGDQTSTHEAGVLAKHYYSPTNDPQVCD